MRILVAHNFYRTPGGEDHYVRSLIRLLKTKPDPVRLLSYSSDGMSKPRAAAQMLSRGGLQTETFRDVERFKPDVIHLHNAYPAIGARGARQLAEIAPLVMTLHNYRLRCPNGVMFTQGTVCERCVEGSTYNALRHKCLGSTAQSATYAATFALERQLGSIGEHVSAFICPSEFLKRKMGASGFSEARLNYIPNFSEPVDIGPGRIPQHALFVGRLTAEKGPGLFVEALKSRPTVSGVVIGDGPEAVALRRSAATNVRFLGWLSEENVRAAMRSAKILVIPSRWYENLPLVLLTGMQLGLPILASAWTSVGSLVDSYQAGATFNHDSPASLGEKLDELWEDDERLEEIGARNARTARMDFSPSRHLQLLRELYSRVGGQQ